MAFGPKPRDFSTDLPRKVYDLAWRTALSHRYKKGELLVVDGKAEVKRKGGPFGMTRWVNELLDQQIRTPDKKKAVFVTARRRVDLFSALTKGNAVPKARALTMMQVDVKNLLESGNLIIEKEALSALLKAHRSDLGQRNIPLVST